MKNNKFFSAAVFIYLFTLFMLIGFNQWANQQLDRIDMEIAGMQAELNRQIDRTDFKIEITREQMDLLADVVFDDVPEVLETAVPVTEPVKVSLGIFTVTAYCPCEKCCGKWSNPENPITASGAQAVEGMTVGADWSTIPKGSKIYIEGVGARTVQDKPAKWIIGKYDGKILDLYFSSHDGALKFGKQELEVWIER